MICIAKTICEGKNRTKLEDYHYLIRTYCKATVIKTAGHWPYDCTYKGIKAISGETAAFQKIMWECFNLHKQIINFDLYL